MLFIILSLDLLAMEIMKLPFNKLFDHLYYALLSPAILILAATLSFLDSEQANLEYQPKAKRDTMINRTKRKLQSVTNASWTKIEMMIVNPAHKTQAKTLWHACSQVNAILVPQSPIYGNRCYSDVDKQRH